MILSRLEQSCHVRVNWKGFALSRFISSCSFGKWLQTEMAHVSRVRKNCLMGVILAIDRFCLLESEVGY